MKIFVYFCGKFLALKFREKQFWEENLIFLKTNKQKKKKRIVPAH